MFIKVSFQGFFFCLWYSQNVLLDANLVAKLSDFGFAMQLPQQVGSTQLITAVVGGTLAGTRGYLAPEYIEGKHGIKSDIYIYGVVSKNIRQCMVPTHSQTVAFGRNVQVLYLIYITYDKSI